VITKHTPGPWTVAPDGLVDIDAADGLPVAVATGWLYRTHPECLANVALIAAAPDLLAALRDCEEFIGEHYGRCGYTAPPDTLRKARAAIAAAVRVRE